MALRADGRVIIWGTSTNVPADLPFATAICAGVSNGVAMALVQPSMAATPPTIIAQPFSHTAIIGATVVLSVRAIGFQPFSYQWLMGTNVISGATNSTYFLPIQNTSQSGDYSVVISNGAGSTTSQAATVNVLPAFVGIDMVPRLALQGSVGVNYQVQWIAAIGPTNAWQTLATVLITNQPQYFYDDSAIGQPQRYYRLLETP